MPYIKEIQDEYTNLVKDIIQKTRFESIGDFDLFKQSISCLLEEKSPDTIENKFKDTYGDLKDVLDGFDYYATDDIIVLTKTFQDKFASSPQEVVLVFNSETVDTQERLKEAKLEYRQLIRLAISTSLSALTNKTEEEKQNYISDMLRTKLEADVIRSELHKRVAQDSKETKDSNEENLSLEELNCLYAIRRYIYSDDDHSIRNHRRRAADIHLPGIGNLSAGLREKEYNRFISFLAADTIDAEIIFRGIEVFPEHREHIYNLIHFALDHSALSAYNATLLRIIFPSKNIQRAYSRTTGDLPLTAFSSRDYSVNLNVTSIITYTVDDDNGNLSRQASSVDDNGFIYSPTSRSRLFQMAPLNLPQLDLPESQLQQGGGRRSSL